MDIRELQDFFDQSQDLIAIFDGDLRYEAANAEYCRYWGVSRDGVLGTKIVDVVGFKDYSDGIHEYLLKCLEGESVLFERWIDFPGVGRRHMDVRYSPRLDESGNVTGVFLISRDTTDRMKLQAKLSAERDKLDSILSALDVGLVLFDRKLTIEWVNPKLLSMFPDGEPHGLTCHRFFMDHSRPCEGCPALKAMKTGEVHTKELYRANLDRWFFLTAVPICDEHGAVTQILGHVVDVTDRRRSLEALKAREAELESIFRATQAGIGVVQNRVFTQGNDYLFEMLGYERGELLGKNARVVYASDEDYEYAGDIVYGMIKGRKTAAVETRWQHKDGSMLDVLVTITFMMPSNPDAGATFVAMDITEHKRAERALLESEQRFRKIFEDVDMIAVQGYDPERRVVYWNPASERLYGYSKEEAMGQSLLDLIIPEHMHDVVAAGHDIWLSGGPAIPSGELELLHKDGNTVPVYSSHVMQDTASGEKFMYCVDVDMAEIKRIHNRLVRAKEEAEAANHAKSEFLANMSHEIRTPLNGIQGMLTLLQTTELDETQREYAEAGAESAVRLNRLLSDILDLSRVEAGKMTVEKELFNLPYLVAHLKDIFRLVCQESCLSLTINVDDNVPMNVMGDSARLQQVLTNLVGNGLKYTDEGEVRVDVNLMPPTEDGRHRILFTVSDTGIGIATDLLESLFEPFTQGSQGYSRQYQGAGLGLSICKRLVDLMGGQLAVESESGQGTTVYVTIPFDEEVVPVGVEPPKRSEESGVATTIMLNVLLAEDDRVNSMVGQRMLEKAGCTVSVSSSGRQAIEMLREGDYAAVFMDVQMPDMDGVEATMAIRKGVAGEANRDITIFALTAYTMSGDREKFLEAGMDGHVPKPVEMDDLLRALRLVVKRLRSEK